MKRVHSRTHKPLTTSDLSLPIWTKHSRFRFLENPNWIAQSNFFIFQNAMPWWGHSYPRAKAYMQTCMFTYSQISKCQNCVKSHVGSPHSGNWKFETYGVKFSQMESKVCKDLSYIFYKQWPILWGRGMVVWYEKKEWNGIKELYLAG